ncbi:UNVERIFIED_CONTAM: hypothetical protein Slati_4476600 [Sesamum latifolium]|uniref:Uncharacterized protein n=1 Tax=Sesamum latifolium TaxID=2727402 RepID=A0AAW2SSQ2_9LAMI
MAHHNRGIPPLESEDDLDRLLGEVEAEVRDASCQVGSGVDEEKILEVELPQPMKDRQVLDGVPG